MLISGCGMVTIIGIVSNCSFYHILIFTLTPFRIRSLNVPVLAILSLGFLDRQSHCIYSCHPTTDEIYEKSRKRSISPDVATGSKDDTSPTNEKYTLLLDKAAVPEIVSHFELPPSAETDLLRALEQTTNRLKTGR